MNLHYNVQYNNIPVDSLDFVYYKKRSVFPYTRLSNHKKKHYEAVIDDSLHVQYHHSNANTC